jgi:hypothetical protein
MEEADEERPPIQCLLTGNTILLGITLERYFCHLSGNEYKYIIKKYEKETEHIFH